MVLLILGLRHATRELSQKSSALWRQRLEYYFWLGFFLVFVAFRWLPESAGATHVGQKAPDFTLTDANDKPVTRAQLLTEPINNKPPSGVLLIFCRGYW